jgi:hypothetical protein
VIDFCHRKHLRGSIILDFTYDSQDIKLRLFQNFPTVINSYCGIHAIFNAKTLRRESWAWNRRSPSLCMNREKRPGGVEDVPIT